MIRFARDPSDKRRKIVVLTDIGENQCDAQAAVTMMTKRLAERIRQPQLAGMIAACAALGWGDPIDFEAEATNPGG
ncbi:MAG: hypothetical protein IPM41_13960 [Sphingomonadales bacterium]|nr:hypothetical protein [Sphingomonadales bacterium]